MRQFFFILLIIFVKALYDLVYVFFISDLYQYAGLTLSPDYGRLLISYCAVFAIGVALPWRTQNPSSFHAFLLYLFIVMPILSLWALRGGSDMFVTQVMLGFGLVLLIIRAPMIRVVTVTEGVLVGKMLVVAMVGLALFFLTIRGAFQNMNWNPLKVYALRTEFHEAVMYGFVSYLVIWLGKVLNIAVLIYACWNKNWLLVALSLGTQAILYGVTGHKEFAIYPLLAMFVYFVMQTGRPIKVYFALSIAAVLLAPVASSIIASSPVYSAGFSQLIHRSFAVIGQNHFDYYSFFQESPFVYLSNSILSSFSEYPYQEPVPKLIAIGRYIGDGDPFANTGFLASGYMHFGFFGLLLYSSLVGVFLRLYDSLIVGRVPLAVGTSFSVVQVFQLVNADVLIAFLTQGIGLSMLVLWLMGREKNANQIQGAAIS